MKYNAQKVEELRELCRKEGLSSEGKKTELISRLTAFEKSQSSNDIFKKNEDDFSPQTTFPSNTYILQLKSSNLSNYFNCGNIHPLSLEESEIYKTENRAKDILSKFQDYIVVGKNALNKVEASDVLIELVLDGIKIEEYNATGLFYVAEPIPISRIKSIQFKDGLARSTFLSSIKTFPDSFIPSSICKVASNHNESIKSIDFDGIILPKNERLFYWKERLELFDKILGLFAFIKNTGILYSERMNNFEEYTAGFLGALNIINPIRQPLISKDNILLKPLLFYHNFEVTNAQRAIFSYTIERVYNNQPFDIKIAISILEKSISDAKLRNGDLADIEKIIALFKDLDKLKISYKGILQNDLINKNIPALALLFLAKFPSKSRQNTDKQAVRIPFIENEFSIPIHVAEYILGFLGLHYGYSNMVKEDTNLKFSDKYFEELSLQTQSIKFRVDSYFDRFIIESIFRFSIKQVPVNDNFNFLDWSNEQADTRYIIKTQSFDYDYLDNSFSILKKRVLNIERLDKMEKVFERIFHQYSGRIEDNSYLATFFRRCFALDKDYAIQILKKNKGRYSMNELERVIELDNQNKKKL